MTAILLPAADGAQSADAAPTVSPTGSTAPSRLPAVPAPSARGWGLILLLGAIWGGSFSLVEIGLRELPPFTLVAHRVFWAALTLWALLAAAGVLDLAPGAPLRRAGLWARWAAMGLLNNAIPFSLIVWGQTEIESGLAAIFNATTALLGVMTAALFLADERLSARKALGALIGVLGVALIVGRDALGGLDPRSLGQFAILGAALSYACASVWGRARLGGVSAPLNALGMLSTSALMMVPLAAAVDGPPNLDLSLETWAAVVALSSIATAGAYLLYFAILRETGAANTMLVTLIVPPIAILLGWLFLGERLGFEAFVGFAVIAFGLGVIDGRPARWLRERTRGD
ncbi:MAG: DMT family transporter [Pseudomonadota bacterium]